MNEISKIPEMKTNEIFLTRGYSNRNKITNKEEIWRQALTHQDSNLLNYCQIGLDVMEAPFTEIHQIHETFFKNHLRICDQSLFFCCLINYTNRGKHTQTFLSSKFARKNFCLGTNAREIQVGAIVSLNLVFS